MATFEFPAAELIRPSTLKHCTYGLIWSFTANTKKWGPTDFPRPLLEPELSQIDEMVSFDAQIAAISVDFLPFNFGQFF